MSDIALTVPAARLACIVSLAVAPLVAGAQDAGALLRRSAAAMGANDLKSIRYVAEGIGYSYGQAFKPGLPWPKFNVHGQIRTIHYDSASMRDEIVLSRAEPQGGGGYPLSGAATQRPVPERRARVEPDRPGADARSALRRRSHAPVVDHPTRCGEGRHAARRDAAVAQRRWQVAGRRLARRAGTVTRHRVHQRRVPRRACRVARARHRARRDAGRHRIRRLPRLRRRQVPDAHPAGGRRATRCSTSPSRRCSPTRRRPSKCPSSCARRPSVCPPRKSPTACGSSPAARITASRSR